jgi:hypothetical protein
MPVMLAQCKTCPFRERGPMELRARIEARILSGVNQTCHSTGLARGKRDTHLCRGARDFALTLFHRLGFLSEPTDAAWDRKRREIAQ